MELGNGRGRSEPICSGCSPFFFTITNDHRRAIDPRGSDGRSVQSADRGLIQARICYEERCFNSRNVSPRRTVILLLQKRLESKINLQEVIFLGGDSTFPSVRLRCVEVAKALGCDYVTDINSLDDVPLGKLIFVCVKPELTEEELSVLQTRGVVVWDIHEKHYYHNVDYYLVSSYGAYKKYKELGSIHIIPHHHCNFSSAPNPLRKPSKPSWIGSPEWFPDLGFDVDFYNVKEMTTEDVIEAYRNSTIMINIRGENDPLKPFDDHIAVNPGIKLINSIGFGIPSICNPEPSYFDLGPECTVFSTLADCETWVDRLIWDSDFYGELRLNCILKATNFNMDVIGQKYIVFLDWLLEQHHQT